MSKDMTTGKPLKLIMSFAIPLLLGNIFQQIYAMVDTIVVGRFVGTDALAAVGATASVSGLVIGASTGIAAGFGVLIANFFGAKDYKRLRHCAANIIYLFVILAILITVGALFLARPLLELMQTPTDIIDTSYQYIIVIFGGIAATMLYNVLAYVLRALGDSRSPLYFLIVSSVLNVLLDLLFVAVIPMGVFGAAIATVLSQFISALCCLFYIRFKVPALRLERGDFGPDISLMGRLLYQGIPMAFQLSLTAIGAIILQSAINGLGSDAVAAVTAGWSVQLFPLLILESLGLTMTTYCGQNLGAQKYSRIRKGVRTGLIVALVCSVIGATCVYTFGDKIALIFFDAGEKLALEYTNRFLRLGTFFYPVLALLYVYRGSVQGLGYSLVAMASGMMEMATRTAVALLFVHKIGFDAACVAQPISWIPVVLITLPAFYILLRRHEKKSNVEEGERIQ